MCEYCNRVANNREQNNIDNEQGEFYRLFLLKNQPPLLFVTFNAEDDDGYKATSYFPILYCPMCR